MMNNDLTEKEYLRCNAIETWNHVIRCPMVREMQKDFTTETAEQLFKKNWDKISEDEILEMLEDIVTFFDVRKEDNNEVEFKTSQQCI